MIKQLLAISVFSLTGLCLNAQTILGIDVSSYQGNPTWSSVKSAGYAFAYAKATEGTNIADASFVYNMTNGTTAGVKMGAYHFCDPIDDAASADATYFLSIAQKYITSCNMPPMLDVEDTPGDATLSTMGGTALTTWVVDWCKAVESATGIKPIIYTDGSYAALLQSAATTYGLWIATVSGNPATPPSTTGTWSTWVFDQYSWTGSVPGISGDVDLDVFNGNQTAFNELTPCAPPVCNTYYATVPYSTSFESQWVYDSCAQIDQRLPDKYWKSSTGGTTPDGDDYWHRDDYTGGDWSSPTVGAYTPTASSDSYSARFHNDPPPAGSTGALDLYINLSTAGTKTISFDLIHDEASPAPFKFDVILSIDGGKTFTDTLLRNTAEASSWTTETVTTTATSATSAIRFVVTDKGTEDVGIDNLSVQSTPTGIDEVSTNNDLVVYPNPSDGTVLNGLFSADQTNKNMEVHIYDMMGRDVLTKEVIVEAGRFSIQLSEGKLSAGTYMFIGIAGDKRFMKTVVVK